MVKGILRFLSLGDDDEDNFDDDYYEDEDAYEESYSSKKSTKYASDEKETKSSRIRERDNKQTGRPAREDNISPIEIARKERQARNNRRNSTVSSGTKFSEVCIKKPESYEDVTEICDLLMSGVPVIVSLEGFDNAEAQRTMEFICGCIYALDGNMQQIQKYTFIFSPADININGDFNIENGAVPTFSNEY